MTRVLCVNPGSTSTKLAVFDDDVEVCAATVRHSADEFGRVADQAGFRRALVAERLAAAGVPLASLDAVVGRGGLCRPVPGGTYRVDAALLADLRLAPLGEHASNLGGIVADELAREAGIPAFVVDPVVVDELQPLARYSGHPEIERRSIFHALNQKAVARRHADAAGRPYEELNLVVAHLGGGISVGAHRRGRVVDVNNALDGDGPLAPERAGGLPSASWARLVLSGRYAPDEIRRLVAGGGGLASLLGTSDAAEVDRRVEAGDAAARLARDALCYQVAKEIGSCAAVLRGDVDAILLTGGLAHDEAVVAGIADRVRWIAPVHVYPGEDELTALRDGALRVLRGQERARDYAATVVGGVGGVAAAAGSRRSVEEIQHETAVNAPEGVRLAVAGQNSSATQPVLVVAGHYGSGKTEFAVSLALREAVDGVRVALADLDIVNPYFRSRERAALMEAAGIRVISSLLGHVSTLEIPAISAEVRAPLADPGVEVIIDLGGDAAGAKVLAQFRADVLRRDHRLLVVVNAYRPETADVAGVLAHLDEIEAVTRLTTTGLVSNTHLLRGTTAADVRAGVALCAAVAGARGVPVAYVSAIPDALAGLTGEERDRLESAGTRLLPVGMYLREEWM